MLTYRTYFIERDSHIRTAPQITECEGDEAAIVRASLYLDGHDLEI